MDRIAETFAALKARGRKAFVGYVMAGYPGEEEAARLAGGLLEAGADLLEIGAPFSDPLADGVVIQRCAEAALKAGATLDTALSLARRLRASSAAPLLLMSYYNPLLARGLAGFASEARAAGLDGLIVPDLTPEEAGPARAALEAEGLKLVFLAAPTSTPERLRRVARAAQGFIYVVSVAGVTGERSAFDARLEAAVAGLRRYSPLPLCIGFGVATPEAARQAAGMADGVVAASTVLKEITEGRGVDAALEKACGLIGAAHAAGDRGA